MSVYAYGEAARLLERALQVQEELEPGNSPRTCDFILDLGEALMPAGESQRVVAETAVRALEMAEALGDSERAVRACQLCRVFILPVCARPIPPGYL